MSRSAPIFALGFYRGGTTFLQRLLNCFQELSIWGEHSGFLRDFERAYRAVRTSALHKVNASDYAIFNTYARRFISWANGFDAGEFLAWQRTSVQQLFGIPASGRWGFKEIRYNDLEMMRYLLELYPDSRIVFLVRDPEEILISRMLVRWEDRFQKADEIKLYCKEFEAEWQTALRSAAYLERTTRGVMVVTYDALLYQRRIPQELLEFLDLDPKKINNTLFEAVLDTRAGSSFGDVRNRRLANKEVAERVDCVREFVASSPVLKMSGQETIEPPYSSCKVSPRRLSENVVARRSIVI